MEKIKYSKVNIEHHKGYDKQPERFYLVLRNEEDVRFVDVEIIEREYEEIKKLFEHEVDKSEAQGGEMITQEVLTIKGAKKFEVSGSIDDVLAQFGIVGEKRSQVSACFVHMLNKERISSQDLRRGLGDCIPGIMNIASRAMDVTVADLDKSLRDGTLISKEFVPKLISQLNKEIQ